MDIHVVLPFPPTVNSYWLKTKNGIYLSKAGRFYKQIVLERIREQLPGIVLDDKLHLEVTLYPPDSRQRDLDNYMKGLLDAIAEAGLIENDANIDQLEIRRGVIVRKGLVLVEINPAGPQIPLPIWLRH